MTMTIRKTGAVTGTITGTGQAPGPAIAVTGSLAVPEGEQAVNWTGPDEQGLAAESED
jgi:hypothetical protein